ncbi:MAG: ABC transporter permease subunit [Candidatus Heimdallarchaeota archaeon]|nr:ABC transporter permease subunit [Candidatus Heimdallarchaeota archaeon]
MSKTQIQTGRFENRTTFIFALIVILALVVTDVRVISQTDGTSTYWLLPNEQPSDTFTDVLMISPTETYLTGETGTIYKSTNYTKNYNAVFSASQKLSTIEGNSSFMLAAGANGLVYQSSDGAIWNQIVINELIGKLITDIEIQGKHVWMIGEYGLIAYSNNSAQDFVIQTSPRIENLYGIDFLNASHGWIVGDNGVVLKTTTYGNSWITINSGTTVSLNSINIEVSSALRMWIGGNNGTFLASYGASFGASFLKIDTGTTANINDIYSPIFGIVWAVGEDSTILGFRGNEFKNKQVLEDEAKGINFLAVYAFENEAISVGDKIYYNKEGLIPAFLTEKNWEDWWFFATEVEPLLLVGMVAALKVIAVSITLGFLIGLFMATLRTINNRPLNIFATAYSDLFRNTPMIVQLFFITFGLPELGFNPPLFIDAVMGLSLNTGAYQSEIIRSGIQAIPRGQMEAARSLGMSNIQAMKEIILPQAVRLTIPPLSNEAVILFLNSSLLSVIAYEEITRVGQIVANSTFLYARTFLFVALTYFIVTYSITQILRRVEKKLKIPGLGGGEI